MKNQTKAILASTMILALALSSVAGVTYSWFSDQENLNVNIGTLEVDVDAGLYSDENPITMDSINLNSGTTESFMLMVTNRSNTPVECNISFIIPRYAGFFLNSSTYVGEFRYDGSAYSYDTTLSLGHSSGNAGNSRNNIEISMNGSQFTHVSSGVSSTTILGEQIIFEDNSGQTKTCDRIQYSEMIVSSTVMIAAGNTMQFPILVNTETKTVDGKTIPFTASSIQSPKITVTAIQPNHIGTPIVCIMSDSESTGSFSNSFNISDLGTGMSVIFKDSESKYLVSIGYQTLRTSDLSRITITIDNTASDVTKIVVKGFNESRNPINLDGWISCKINIGQYPPTSVMSIDNNISFVLTKEGTDYVVSFICSASASEFLITNYTNS